MKSLKSFADSKKFKYGTINIVFISVVIAIVIVLNSIVTVLSDAYHWQLDMTEEQLYTISDPLVELIDGVSRDIEIDIIFCQDKDEVETNYSDLSSGNVLAYVHSTATQIAEKIDNVNVVYKDPIKDYEFMDTFTSLSSEMRPNESTVIVARKDKNGNYTNMYRTYHTASFYTFAEEVDGTRTIYGYNGEKIFATAILSLTMDKVPTVYFVTGHGEELAKITSEGKYTKHESIVSFEECGFDVRYIDLSDKQYTCATEGCGESWGLIEFDFSEDPAKKITFTCEKCNNEQSVNASNFADDRQIPETARAVVICNPESDYGQSETVKLSQYLISSKGTIMCFVDPEGQDVAGDHPLKNLHTFIKQETGVTIVDNDKIKDSASSLGYDTYDFRGAIADNNAASIYLSALQGFGASRPMFEDSGYLEIDERYSNADTQGFNNMSAQRYTLPLIVTDASAEFGNTLGRYTVMSVTSLTSIRDNEAAYSYFVVCPSASFVSDEILTNTAYKNEEILYSLIHSTTAVNVPVNLDFKTFNNYDLDISASQQRTMFICLVTILPALTVASGVFVLVRRKNK